MYNFPLINLFGNNWIKEGGMNWEKRKEGFEGGKGRRK